MSDATFAVHVAAVAMKYNSSSTENSYQNLHDPYWNQIILQQYNFGHHTEEFEYLKAIAKKDILEFYHKHFTTKNSPEHQKLVTRVAAQESLIRKNI